MLVHRPQGRLAAHVECIWAMERGALPHARERMVATGCADIVVPLLQDAIIRHADETAPATSFRGAIVQGAHDRYAVRGTGGASSVVGVHFRAGGAAAFFGRALPDLRNRTVLLEDLWGREARTLRERLQAEATLEARVNRMVTWLLARLDLAATVPAAVSFALDAFARDPSDASVEPIREATGLGAARFIRHFEDAVGLTPKRYARVLRFNALLPSLARQGPRDWAEVAVEAGYFDQSHLIHDFKRLAGVTPAAYKPVSPHQPTHIALAPNLRHPGEGRDPLLEVSECSRSGSRPPPTAVRERF